jgi:2-methylisocitrate lyase-like PEP mutase family enzyme
VGQLATGEIPLVDPVTRSVGEDPLLPRLGLLPGAQGGVDDDELSSHPSRLGQEGRALPRGEVPIEVTREHPVEGAIGHDQVQRVADKSQPLGETGLGQTDHRPALVDPDNEAAQVSGEEAGAAGHVEGPGRGQPLHQGDELPDGFVPARPVPAGEQPGPEIPVVVLPGPALVVLGGLVIGRKSGKGRHAPNATLPGVRPTQAEKAQRFADLHRPGRPLLLPNPWDAGSARVLASLGFEALATTSGGFAATLGRLDGAVRREEVLAHAASIVAATDVPVSADYEDGFAADPEAVGVSVTMAAATGLAGLSVEDFTRRSDDPIYDLDLAVARVAAAAAAAHRGPARLVLTARAEGRLHGRGDFPAILERLQAFAEAGADVVFAPGVTDLDEIARLVRDVPRPVNVLALPGTPSVPELASVGVARVSVGGAFAYAALGALVEAATELQSKGTFGYWAAAQTGRAAARTAFTS